MKVYKLQGRAKCGFCGDKADLYVDEIHIAVCKKCGVALYRNLGEHFVPRAVPNIMLRSEKQYRPLSMVLTEEEYVAPASQETEEKKEKTKDIFEKFKNIFKRFSKKAVKGETNERQTK